MEIEKKYSTLGPWCCVKTLGVGSFGKVRLAFNPETGQHAAIKIINPSKNPSVNVSSIMKEAIIMNNLKHPHIIGIVDFYQQVEYAKKKGVTENVLAIVMELARGGELFEYVKYSGRFSEIETRTYFKQLIETVEFCHGRNVTHRDLKPENLLFDADFNLKIADFGFATLLAGSDDSGKLTTLLGTPSYAAPEILLKQSYSGAAVDLFACGVILFVMYTGSPPFVSAMKQDSYYKFIVNNSMTTFWNYHEKNKVKVDGKNFYSDSFRDLIGSMLAFEPDKRLSLAQIKDHPWYNGEVADIKDVRAGFEKRRLLREEKLAKEKENQRKREEQLKQMANVQPSTTGGVFTGFGTYKGRSTEATNVSLESSLKELKFKFDVNAKRVLAPYKEDVFKTPTTQVFSLQDADTLLKKLAVFCDKEFENYTISNTDYKIKGCFRLDSGPIEICISITKVDDEATSIELIRKKGSLLQFHQIVDQKFKAELQKLGVC